MPHVLIWAHTRREFFEARDYEPDRCDTALDYINKLYRIESEIREQRLEDAKKQNFEKQSYRALNSLSTVNEFFEWLKAQKDNAALLPSNKFNKAAAYALKREQGLRVFLSDIELKLSEYTAKNKGRVAFQSKETCLFKDEKITNEQVR